MQIFRPCARCVPGTLLALWACGTPASPPHPPTATVAPVASASAAVAEPQDEPLPTLRTGALPPDDAAAVTELPVVERHEANGYECIALQLPSELGERAAVYTVPAAAGAPVPFVFPASAPRGKDRKVPEAWVWVRRPTSHADVTGDIFLDASSARPGRHVPFHASLAAGKPSTAAALAHWLDGLSESRGRWRWGSSPYESWVNTRIAHLAEALTDEHPGKAAASKGKGKPLPAPVRPRPRAPVRPGDLAGFIETTTGLTAVQETLQTQRALWYAAPERQPTVPIAQLEPPALRHHPWADMLAKLPAPPPEPLASSAPADFYYVRAAGLVALFDALDQVDAWGTAANQVLSEVAEERDLAARYETQLALRRGPLTRLLGPAVIGEVALVGSDPYVEDGTDVTVLLRVKDRTLFEAAMAATQADLEAAHGALVHETRDHGGVSVRITRSQDGAVRQQRATRGDLELVSNSPAALDAVIDASLGKRPRLADELDFRFMLARDAKESADVLAFLGDRFVADVVGPRQKVLQLRRQDAAGELAQLGYAALLFGAIQGRSPTKADELVGAGLLAPEELAHTGGEPIAWVPGSAPRSSWGTPAALTPLIDRPPLDKVSPDEKGTYVSFARSYQENFSHYIDPAAIRVVFGGSAGSPRTMKVSLRELPLIDQTKYREISDFVGAARFVAQPATVGARIVAGISHDSDVRKDLSRTLRALSDDKLRLDWLGDWAAVGVADRTVVAKVGRSWLGDKGLQKPAPSRDDDTDDRADLSQLATLPLYAEIAVKGPAQAALALAGLRVLADQTIPGMFTWGEVSRHRDVPVVRVALKGDVAKDLLDRSGELDVFYALANGALVVATQEWLVQRLVDERLDGRAPSTAASGSPSGTQLSFDLASGPGKGLWTVLAWLAEQELLEGAESRSSHEAEALLRGAPETAGDGAAARALSLAYFGATPVTVDGAAFTLVREGVRDPARGTAYAPVWPDVPVPGSPVDKVMRGLSGLHTQVGFDDEGKDGERAMRSLHATALFDLAR